MSPREPVQQAVLWGTALSAVLKLGQVLVSLVLVRLLTPEVYGQFGLLSAILTFVYVLSMQRFMEFSFHQQDDELDTDAQLSFGLALHIGLFVLVNIAASLLALIDQYAVIEVYLRVASLAILINVPRIYHSVLLQRQMRWRRIRGLHLASFALSSVVALALAVTGFGLWSLVVHALLVPVPFVLDALPTLRDARLRRPRSGFLPTLKFGLLRNATAGVGAVQGLLESSLLVVILGYATFGLFGRALALASLVAGLLSQPLNSVLYPVFAGLESGSPGVARLCGLLVRALFWTGLPLCLLLAFEPTPIVLLVFGQRWLEVAPLLPMAAFLVLAQLVRQTLGMVLTSQVGPGPLFRVELVILVATGGALAISASGDLIRYLVLMNIASWLMVAWMLWRLIRHELLPGSELARMLATLACGALLAVLGLTVLGSIPAAPAGLPGAILTAVIIATGFLAAVRLLDANALAQLIDYLPGATIIRKILYLERATV